MRHKCLIGVYGLDPHALYLAESVRVSANNELCFILDGKLYKYEFSVSSLKQFANDLIIDCSKLKLIEIVLDYEEQV